MVTDLFVRNIVGWLMSNRITEHRVLDALAAAYLHHKPNQIVNSYCDQGFQDTRRRFRKLLYALNIEPSVSRRRNCWDNAVAERFFSDFRKEKIRRVKYKTRDEARQAMFHYVEMFYNPKWRHTNNGRYVTS